MISSIHFPSLLVSLAALSIASFVLLSGNRERRGSSGPEPDHRHAAMAAEIEMLRGELASLREALDRRPPVAPAIARSPMPAEPVGTELAESATSHVQAAEAPAEFQVRRALIDGFHGLTPGDRRAALDRLAEMARWGDAEAMRLILASLEDESAGVRAQALKELARLDESGFPDHLRRSIADPSHKVREVVASRLDELPAKEAGPLLVGMLADPDFDVVIEAIQSLVRLEYTEARPVLVEQLDSRSLEVATRAAQALMELGDKAAAGGTIDRIMLDLAKDDVSGRIKNVKRLRRLRAVNPLERLLASDPSLAVREEARVALASLED